MMCSFRAFRKWLNPREKPVPACTSLALRAQVRDRQHALTRRAPAPLDGAFRNLPAIVRRSKRPDESRLGVRRCAAPSSRASGLRDSVAIASGAGAVTRVSRSLNTCRQRNAMTDKTACRSGVPGARPSLRGLSAESQREALCHLEPPRRATALNYLAKICSRRLLV